MSDSLRLPTAHLELPTPKPVDRENGRLTLSHWAGDTVSPLLFCRDPETRASLDHPACAIRGLGPGRTGIALDAYGGPAAGAATSMTTYAQLLTSAATAFRNAGQREPGADAVTCRSSSVSITPIGDDEWLYTVYRVAVARRRHEFAQLRQDSDEPGRPWLHNRLADRLVADVTRWARLASGDAATRAAVEEQLAATRPTLPSRCAVGQLRFPRPAHPATGRRWQVAVVDRVDVTLPLRIDGPLYIGALRSYGFGRIGRRRDPIADLASHLEEAA